MTTYDEKKTRSVTVPLDAGTRRAIERMSRELETSMAQVVRLCVSFFLDSVDDFGSTRMLTK